MKVLGIESSCDETACAIVRGGKEILSNVVMTQSELHEVYGGVVPELACRRHIEVILPVLDKALSQAKIGLNDLDLIAVAHGPGLIGALLIGLNTAKALSLATGKPFIGVNHIEAHLYAALMSQPHEVQFPCLGVVLSGGHTSLIRVDAIGRYHPISHTVDDAIGEAFDKVAKILGLPYPGGPHIELLAKQGDPTRYRFHSGQVKENPLAFSFSGLKTAVLYALQRKTPSESDKCDLAASFQQAAFKDILQKTLIAARQYECKSLLFGGGVTNNQTLRSLFAGSAGHLEQYWPAKELTLDNAAMIAGLGYHLYRERGSGDALNLSAQPSLAI